MGLFRKKGGGFAGAHPTLEAAQARIKTEDHPEEWEAVEHGQQIVLVAHGGILDMVYRLASRQEMQAPRTWHLGNAAINRLLWTPQGLSLVGWGDVSHFDEAHDAPRDETTTT